MRNKGMPLYEYKCGDCGLKFEMMRPMSLSSEPAECKRCGNKAGRVLSVFAAFAKGSDGESPTPVAGGSSCAGCTATSCASCH